LGCLLNDAYGGKYMVKKANWELSFDKEQHQLVPGKAEGGNHEPPDHKTDTLDRLTIPSPW